MSDHYTGSRSTRGVRAWSRLQLVVSLLAGVELAIFAFSHLFTTFVRWDDEGYFLLAYRDFLSGHVLYNQVFSFYGPLSFFLGAIATGFKPGNITHDSLRWMVLVLWLMTASLVGAVVWRSTRRFSVSIAAFLLVGLQLQGLAKAVGHPQVWTIVSFALLLRFGLGWVLESNTYRVPLAFGAIVGALLMFKINIGVYVCIAVGLALSLQATAKKRHVFSILFLTAAVLLVAALFFSATTFSERVFAIILLMALACIVDAASLQPATKAPVSSAVKWSLIGFFICISITVGLTFALGTTPRGLIEGLVIAPAVLTRSYHYPFLEPVQIMSLLMCAGGLSTAVFFLGRRHLVSIPPTWVAICKVAAGCGLLCAFAYNNREALTGSLLFLWLLPVDVSGPARLDRLLLASIAALASLQVYPMAGEQVDWASLLPIIAAAVLLGDGINSLAVRTEAIPRAFAFGGRGAAWTLAGMLLIIVGITAFKSWTNWEVSTPVALPGAAYLRLPDSEATRLAKTSNELHRHCSSVLLVPGLYSFAVWSGVPPAEAKRVNSWPFLFSKEAGIGELDQIWRREQACVLVSDNMFRFFRGLAVSRHADTMLDEIRRTMNPIYSLQDLTIYRPSEMSSSRNAIRSK